MNTVGKPDEGKPHVRIDEGVLETERWAARGGPSPERGETAGPRTPCTPPRQRSTLLVALHPKREVIERCQAVLAEHLRDMGLELKPSKTRITHTLQVEEGEAGFDFLGFNIRQYPMQSKRGYKTIIKPSREAMARHQRHLRAVVRRHRMDTQARLIEALNPVIRGWSHYF